MLINSARPKMEYAKSEDIHIAYMTLPGNGAPLIFVPGLLSHLDLLWEAPSIAWFLRRLAGFSKLIVFDKRGTGLSDPVIKLPSTTTRMDDIRAVMDAVGVRKAILFGASEGGSLCTLFAAHYPERTLGLVLFGAFARLRWAPDYPFGWDDEQIAKFGSGDRRGNPNPSIMDDARIMRWERRFLRCATSPRMFADLLTMNVELDIRSFLARIAVPTLVMARKDDSLIDPRHGRFMADNIPSAVFKELPGVDHSVWYGDCEGVIDEIEAFLSKVAPSRGNLSMVSLTPREKQVVHDLFAGDSAVEISQRLRISRRTVESHIASIYGKLGINSRADLISLNELSD